MSTHTATPGRQYRGDKAASVGQPCQPVHGTAASRRPAKQASRVRGDARQGPPCRGSGQSLLDNVAELAAMVREADARIERDRQREALTKRYLAMGSGAEE